MSAPFLQRTANKIPSAEDRREAARLKSYAETWADPGGMDPAIPCRIIDISSTGAKLESRAPLPDDFVLHVGAAKHAAHVVWRRQSFVGVEFQKGMRSYRESGRLPPRG